MIAEEIIEKLKGTLSEKRFNHTMGVAKEAVRLAKHYGGDEEKAYIAGLLHDCAKEISYEDSLKLIEEKRIEADELLRQCRGIVHGPVGEYLAKEEYGVTDKEILSAIRYHSTGRSNMTLLEKIIFLADFIEPGRKFEDIDKAREIAYEDIDDAIIFTCNKILAFTINNHKIIHNDTLDTRNYLIIQKRLDGGKI